MWGIGCWTAIVCSMRLALVMPVFNEVALLPRILERIDAVPPPPGVERIICLVDDGSSDGTGDLVQKLALDRTDTKITVHRTNQGKGGALRTGFQLALDHQADIILVQDADLEYDPSDHHPVLKPILDGKADAVIGSRFLGQAHRVLYYWHYIANLGITTFSNMCTNLNLSDIECGTKAFTREVLSRITIEENTFAVEPELIAKLAKMKIPDAALDRSGPTGGTRPLRIFEVPVSYWGRTYEEGKKIRPSDGWLALKAIVRHNWE